MTNASSKILTDFCLKDDDFGKPEEPTDEDCCHSGCTPCVFDVYQKELEKWSQRLSKKQNHDIRYDLLSKTRFNPFRLVRTEVLASCIKKLVFEACHTDKDLDIGGVLPYEPGEHLVLRCFSDEMTGQADLLPDALPSPRPLSRAYSLVWDPELRKNCRFEIVVKLYKHGAASSCLKELKIDDITHWRGPYGGFPYMANTYKNILGLCIGTGVVPIYSITKHILNNEDDFTRIKIFFGIRQPDEIILRDELCELASFWNFKFVYYITGDSKLNFTKRYRETLKSGRMTAEAIVEGIEASKLAETLILICGSEDFGRDMTQYAVQHGVPMKNIHVF